MLKYGKVQNLMLDISGTFELSQLIYSNKSKFVVILRSHEGTNKEVVLGTRLN